MLEAVFTATTAEMIITTIQENLLTTAAAIAIIIAIYSIIRPNVQATEEEVKRANPDHIPQDLPDLSGIECPKCKQQSLTTNTGTRTWGGVYHNISCGSCSLPTQISVEKFAKSKNKQKMLDKGYKKLVKKEKRSKARAQKILRAIQEAIERRVAKKVSDFRGNTLYRIKQWPRTKGQIEFKKTAAKTGMIIITLLAVSHLYAQAVGNGALKNVEHIRTLFAAIAGIATAIIALWRAKTADEMIDATIQQRLSSENIQKIQSLAQALENIGNPEASEILRAGAIQTLRRIAETNKEVWEDAIKILTEFVVSDSKKPEAKERTETPIDVTEAVKALIVLNGKHEDIPRHERAKIDISGAQLQGIKLQKANFQGFKMRNCNLENSELRFLNLSGTDISGGSLKNMKAETQVTIRGTGTKGTDMSGADLTGCDMDFTQGTPRTKDMSQELKGIKYEQNNPPKHLPYEVKIREEKTMTEEQAKAILLIEAIGFNITSNNVNPADTKSTFKIESEFTNMHDAKGKHTLTIKVFCVNPIGAINTMTEIRNRLDALRRTPNLILKFTCKTKGIHVATEKQSGHPQAQNDPMRFSATEAYEVEIIGEVKTA